MNPADAPGESKPTLLIVDDDQELCAMLAEYLAPEGFLTLTAGTGPAGLEQLGRAAVDLVVLDVMLPELSGFEVLRRIRAVSRVPVIMLTARGEEVDRVVGLEMGADDYLAKPFSPRELVARIRAVLRRMPGEGQSASGLILWGPLRLDLRARRADIADRDLELTSAELRILELLVRADTRTVTRDELMTQALGRSEEHTSELQSQSNLVCRLLLENKTCPGWRARGSADHEAGAPLPSGLGPRPRDRGADRRDRVAVRYKPDGGARRRASAATSDAA